VTRGCHSSLASGRFLGRLAIWYHLNSEDRRLADGDGEAAVHQPAAQPLPRRRITRRLLTARPATCLFAPDAVPVVSFHPVGYAMANTHTLSRCPSSLLAHQGRCCAMGHAVLALAAVSGSSSATYDGVFYTLLGAAAMSVPVNW
jgi:hypothetical protein